MRRNIRNIRNKKYIYFTQYNRKTRETKNIYCGHAEDPKAIMKACKVELVAIKNAKQDLTTREKEIRDEMEKIRNSV